MTLFGSTAMFSEFDSQDVTAVRDHEFRLKGRPNTLMFYKDGFISRLHMYGIIQLVFLVGNQQQTGSDRWAKSLRCHHDHRWTKLLSKPSFQSGL